MDCSELMGSKASDVAVVGSRYPSSELLLYSAISHPDISTSTMTPQMYITQRVTRKTRASRSSLYFDTDLITPRYSHSLEIRKQIRLATPNKTYLLMAPQTQKQWTVQGIAKDFSNLTLNKDVASRPRFRSVHGASLNYRDLVIAKVIAFTRGQPDSYILT
jgi:hypothetical protein